MHPFGIPKYVCELNFAGESTCFRQECLLLDKVFTFAPHLEQETVTENTHNRWANNADKFDPTCDFLSKEKFERALGPGKPVVALQGRSYEESFGLLLVMQDI